MAKVVVKKGAVAANQSMMQQIQEPHRQNARLRSTQSGTPGPRPRIPVPSTPQHTPHQSPTAHRRGSSHPRPPTHPGLQDPTPAPPSYRRTKDRTTRPLQKRQMLLFAVLKSVGISRRASKRMSANLIITRWLPSTPGSPIVSARKR